MAAGRETEIVERMGRKFEGEGLPRTAGRILGALLLSPEPLTLDAIAGRLLVSRSGVGSNARLLERIGTVRRVTRPGDRRDFYEVSDDLPLRLLEIRLEQLRTTQEILELALTDDAAVEEPVRARIMRFGRFFRDMLALVETANKRWQGSER